MSEGFAFHDRTGSGALSGASIANAVHALGVPATEAQLATVTAAHAAGGSVSLDAFRALVVAARALVAKEMQALPALFAVLDDDKDGVISKITLKHYLTSIGNKMSAHDVDELFASKGAAGDNIDCDLFCKLLTP